MLSKLTTPLACLLFCIAIKIPAQDKVDSLKSLLDDEKLDTTTVNIFLSLYEELKYVDPDQASDYLKKSLTLSKGLEDPRVKVEANIKLGNHLISSSQYDSALQSFTTALAIAREKGNLKKEMESMVGQGRVLIELQKLDQADSIATLCMSLADTAPVDSTIISECYSIFANTAYFRTQHAKSLEFDQKSLNYNKKDPVRRAKSLLNLSTTHLRLRDYEKAMEYASNGLEQANTSGDNRTIALLNKQLGKINFFIEKFDEAKKHYALAFVYYETVNDLTSLASLQYNLAEIHVSLKEFDLAIKEFKRGLEIINQTNSPLGKAHITYQIGLTYHKMGNYSNAENYYLKAKSLFSELDNPLMDIYIAKRLSDLYAGIGEYKKGYEYLLKFKLLNDSIFNVNKLKEFAEVEEKYQNAQKEQEIELLSAENQIASLELEKQETQRNYLIVAAFFLILLIGLVFSRYQLKAKANARLKELDTLKTNFFTNISHEFRTPLTLILSPLQKLLQQNSKPETKEALTIIHRNATVLTELTNQLLDLSKLEAGKLRLEVVPRDFKAFIKVLIASFESLAVAQKVEFITEIKNAPESAFFDEDKIQKILNNLLSNAFKFTSKEGKVLLSVEQKDERLLISIQDTGKGISEADQELIFKRFHQNNSNESSIAGTGVGLTLSKELALLHKGDIEVKSKIGEGSTFTFHFPINKSAYRVGPAAEDYSKTGPLNQIQKPLVMDGDTEVVSTTDKIVLIVEDNADLRAHMKSLLKGDYIIREAINGKQGINDAINLVPDIIVSDLMMPEVDGIELCNTLKVNEKTSHIPMILLTAKADRETKLEGLKTGADDFLTKPFDNEELRIRIQNLLAQRENLQSKYAQTLRLEPSKIIIDSPEEIFLKRALHIVDLHLSNSEFTVEAFQKEMGMSRMQLHRKLKALTNFSASEFIRDIRLQRAADLLAANQINVAEVAYSCGFNSVSYFTQCFTEKHGTNPSKYIKKAS